MDLETIYRGVIAGNAPGVEVGVKELIAEGLAPATVLNMALIPAMQELGRLYETGEVFVPEMLVGALAMQAALGILRPLLAETGVAPVGTIAIGTVAGDLHDIGKNLVGMMLEGAGFQVNDLGTDVSPERFVQAASDGVQVLGLSALLTTTMPAIKSTLDALVKANVRDRVKVMIGGAPITQEYADSVGADGYAPDAASAVRVVCGLLNDEIRI